MRRLFFIFLLISLAGCATSKITKMKFYESDGKKLDKAFAIGLIVDNRLKSKEGEIEQRQVHTSMGKIKNTISQRLEESSKFRKIVNIPIKITGSSLPDMLLVSRKSGCEYLIVGGVDQFDVKSLGQNASGIFAVFMEILTGPFGTVVFLLSGQKGGIWTNGIIKDRTTEVVLSLSLSIINVTNGKIVGNVNISTNATRPTNMLVYGDLSDPSDDWLDIGKELGEVTTNNLAVDLIDILFKKVKALESKKEKPKEKESTK